MEQTQTVKDLIYRTKREKEIYTKTIFRGKLEEVFLCCQNAFKIIASLKSFTLENIKLRVTSLRRIGEHFFNELSEQSAGILATVQELLPDSSGSKRKLVRCYSEKFMEVQKLEKDFPKLLKHYIDDVYEFYLENGHASEILDFLAISVLEEYFFFLNYFCEKKKF